jgi:hypothetical protein
LAAVGCHQVDLDHERLGADGFDQPANFAQMFPAPCRERDGSEVAGQPKRRRLSDA